jgi:hypothetical protein
MKNILSVNTGDRLHHEELVQWDGRPAVIVTGRSAFVRLPLASVVASTIATLSASSRRDANASASADSPSSH